MACRSAGYSCCTADHPCHVGCHIFYLERTTGKLQLHVCGYSQLAGVDPTSPIVVECTHCSSYANDRDESRYQKHYSWSWWSPLRLTDLENSSKIVNLATAWICKNKNMSYPPYAKTQCLHVWTPYSWRPLAAFQCFSLPHDTLYSWGTQVSQVRFSVVK